MLCCGLEKNGMLRAGHWRGMESANQTRPHYVTQMGKTYTKSLAAWHGRGTAWARPAMCESAFNMTELRMHMATAVPKHSGCLMC